MLLVQLGINTTRDVWKFCQSPTSLVLLITNCTRQRMITYTNIKSFAIIKLRGVTTKFKKYNKVW